MVRCPSWRCSARLPTCQACAYGGALSGCTMLPVQNWMSERDRGAGSGSTLTCEPTVFIGRATAMSAWSETFTSDHQLNLRGRECTYPVLTASRLPLCPPPQCLNQRSRPSCPPLREHQPEHTHLAHLPHRTICSASESPRAKSATSCPVKALPS
jgi:hypothetical protein